MNRIHSVIVYLVVFIGGGLNVWLAYKIASESFVGMIAGADKGYTRPGVVITSPTNEVVSQPIIQIIGYFPVEIQTITFDVTNADGLNRSQANGINQGYVTSRFFDKRKHQASLDRIALASSNWVQQAQQSRTNPGVRPIQPNSFSDLYESGFTTNFFQIYDVNLATGKNQIIIHIRAESGQQYSYRRLFTLDLASDKTPPEIKLVWPKDGTSIGGDRFNLQAKVDDDNAQVRVLIDNSNGKQQMHNAVVGRGGTVWAENVPIAYGTNKVEIIATDPAGNSNTNVFRVTRSPVSVTMHPLEKDQLNKASVHVRGTVTDAKCSIKVNGIQAKVHEDGTWEAEGVPVSPTGTASFEVKVFRN
jgi:hypothetical protein